MCFRLTTTQAKWWRNRNSNISQQQGYSAIRHNFQTSDINNIVQLFSDPGNTIKSQLLFDSSRVVCTKTTIIPPQARPHFPLPRGQLSSLHLMSTLPHFPYFPNAKASFHKSNISVSFKLREKIRVIGIYPYMKFLCIIQKWRVYHMFGSYFDQ